LGRAVAIAGGEAIFDAVEAVRRCMVRFREADGRAEREDTLDRAAGLIAGLGPDRKAELARAYTLYLQLVNVCENAYRTHRLRAKQERDPAGESRPRDGADAGPPAGARITFVLTAHPTESRSPGNIRLLRRIQDHVLASLEAGRGIDRREIGNLIQRWARAPPPSAWPSSPST
jgi:phosphoenolpyruvate carboxylase